MAHAPAPTMPPACPNPSRFSAPADAEAAPEPPQSWRTFLANHARDLVSIDFFTVPTGRLRVLFVLVMLAHHRRRVVHFNVTEHPTAAWPPSRSWTRSRMTPRRPTSFAIATPSTASSFGSE